MAIRWRLCQFSLRSLFGAVAVVSAILGWLANDAVFQHRAVSEISLLGGDVIYDYEGQWPGSEFSGPIDHPHLTVFHDYRPPPGPSWLPLSFRQALLANVTQVYMCDESVGDDTIERLKRLERLTLLVIYAPDASEDVLAEFRRTRPDCRLFVCGRAAQTVTAPSAVAEDVP